MAPHLVNMKILKKKCSKLQLLWLPEGGKTFEGLDLSQESPILQNCVWLSCCELQLFYNLVFVAYS